MIVVATILALLPAAITRWQQGSVVTPDGRFYLAMGRGEFVPRPYSLRSIARWVSNWEAVSITSMVITAIGLYVWASALHGSMIGVITCAFWGALPATRRLASWTTLVDHASQLSIILAGIASLWSPWLALPIVLAGQIAHERIALYGPLMMWVTSGDIAAPVVCLIASYVAYTVRYEAKAYHPMEREIEWLREPFRYSVEQHRQAAHDWTIWLMPWGIVWAWLLAPSWHAIVAVLIAYGSLAVSVDRVRTMQAAPFVLCLCAALALPLEFAFLGYVITLFIPDRHV